MTNDNRIFATIAIDTHLHRHTQRIYPADDWTAIKKTIHRRQRTLGGPRVFMRVWARLQSRDSLIDHLASLF